MVIDKIKKRTQSEDNVEHRSDIPVGKWVKCEKCKEILYKEQLHENLSVCPYCKNHFRLSSRRRVAQIIDEGTFQEFLLDFKTDNPLEMPEYLKKIQILQEKTGLDEAVKCGIGKVYGQEIILCVMDSNFLMGSMGKVVGDKITYSIEKAIKLQLPLVIFCASGGARMQEGIISLMQMAKTSAAIAKLHQAGNLYISVLTDPTYGGVTASFAMLGDVILAEPNAMIGFAGPRVIKQTIGQELPEGFQTAEFLLEHGFIDRVIPRSEMKDSIYQLLVLNQKCDYSLDKTKKGKIVQNKSKKSAWEKVQIVRDVSRPTALDYIENVFNDFLELHGDRYYQDDLSTVCGIGRIQGKSFTIIAQQKGRTTKENIQRNFGMPNPEAYRKALRFMKQAEKFERPIITFIDTKGAYPGLGAEERGQGEAIASNLMEMSQLKVPIIAIVIGEGSSGGALGIGVADKVFMLENSIYSILSPEGYASILWKDSTRAEEAAEKMKLTAQDLLNLHVIDGIILEPKGNASKDILKMSDGLRQIILDNAAKLDKIEKNELLKKRYQKFREM